MCVVHCRLLAAIEGMKTVMMHSAELLLSVDPSQYTYSAGISFFDVVSCKTSLLLLSNRCRSQFDSAGMKQAKYINIFCSLIVAGHNLIRLE